MTLLIIICICIICMYVMVIRIITKNDKNKTTNINLQNDEQTSKMGLTEGVFYPIHIKYIKKEKRIYQDEKLAFWDNILNGETEVERPPYYCVLDNNNIFKLSMGQEVDLDIYPGEHTIFFKSSFPRVKND